MDTGKNQNNGLLEWMHQYNTPQSVNYQKMQQIAIALSGHLQGGLCFALYAPLGGGKTSFVQLVGKALGIHEPMTSPTFNLYEKYDLPQGLSIYHFDLYRINSVDELLNLEFIDIWYDAHAISFIEWPEKAGEELPELRINLHFDYPIDIEKEERVFYVTHTIV